MLWDSVTVLDTNLTLYWSSHISFLLTICPFLFLYRKLHQQFESYKDQVKKMGEESKQTQDQKSEAPTCGICHKTKFADGCGHLCSYCQTKFCARCGGRVSLRSNKVTLARMLATFHLWGRIYTHTYTHADVPPWGKFLSTLVFEIRGYETLQWNHNLGTESTVSLMATNVFQIISISSSRRLSACLCSNSVLTLMCWFTAVDFSVHCLL